MDYLRCFWTRHGSAPGCLIFCPISDCQYNSEGKQLKCILFLLLTFGKYLLLGFLTTQNKNLVNINKNKRQISLPESFRYKVPGSGRINQISHVSSTLVAVGASCWCACHYIFLDKVSMVESRTFRSFHLKQSNLIYGAGGNKVNAQPIIVELWFACLLPKT